MTLLGQAAPSGDPHRVILLIRTVGVAAADYKDERSVQLLARNVLTGRDHTGPAITSGLNSEGALSWADRAVLCVGPVLMEGRQDSHW